MLFALYEMCLTWRFTLCSRYSDDPAFGKPAPSIETLEYFKGEPVVLGGGKVTRISLHAVPITIGFV